MLEFLLVVYRSEVNMMSWRVVYTRMCSPLSKQMMASFWYMARSTSSQ